MTEITVSTRLPKELEQQLEAYMKAEHLEKASAIRRLLFKSLQAWREEYALELLSKGKVTILKAAEIAEIDIWEFVAKLKDLKLHWVSEKTIRKDLEALE